MSWVIIPLYLDDKHLASLQLVSVCTRSKKCTKMTCKTTQNLMQLQHPEVWQARVERLDKGSYSTIYSPTHLTIIGLGK